MNKVALALLFLFTLATCSSSAASESIAHSELVGIAHGEGSPDAYRDYISRNNS